MYKSAILLEKVKKKDDDDELDPETMTEVQLKEEFNKQNYKVTRSKAELLTLLKAALVVEKASNTEVNGPNPTVKMTAKKIVFTTADRLVGGRILYRHSKMCQFIS